MWNYRYLSATLNILARKLVIKEDSANIINEDDIRFVVVRLEDNFKQTLTIPIQAIAELVKFNWDKVQQRVNLHRNLTDKQGFNKLEDCLSYIYLYECVKGLVTNAQSIENGIAYVYGGQVDHVLVDKKRLTEHKRQCLAAECILGGYSIDEYMGKHHVVHTPAGLEHLISHGTCSCNEYSDTRDCDHIYLVAQCQLNRKEFLAAGVLNLLV